MIDRFEKMKRMRETVKAELSDIPRGELPQNMLRAFYWDLRMNSLGKKPEIEGPKEEVFCKAVEMIRKDNPEFEPNTKGEFSQLKCPLKKKEV